MAWWLTSLVSNQRLSPMCDLVANVVDPAQYDLEHKSADFEG